MSNAAAPATPRRWTLDSLADFPGSHEIDAPCLRCAGAGRLVVHANVMGGVCFACRGAGVRCTTVKAERARLRGIARREQQQADRAAAHSARYDDDVATVAALLADRFGFDGVVFPAPATYSDGGDWAVWIDFCRATDGLWTGITPREAVAALR